MLVRRAMLAEGGPSQVGDNVQDRDKETGRLRKESPRQPHTN